MDFFDKLKSEYNIDLNEQQKKAVLHTDGPALVLAGPGSGKTTVIISRLAYLLLERGIDPSSILSMTFNRAAALEMDRRFTRIFASASEGKTRFSTLHSFCYGIVREYQRLKGIQLTLIEGADGPVNKRSVLKGLYYKVNSTYINDDELDTLINEIGYVKNKMLREIEKGKFTTSGFEAIYSQYEEYKKANRLIDFDDMLTMAYGILKANPAILERYRKKYNYFQIDEGQDLSRIQFEILKLMAMPRNNVFLVADDDQSIYGFRGAEPQYILNFKDNFPGAQVHYLEKNYRSTRNIVEISSSLIRNNKSRYDKQHNTDNSYKQDPNIADIKDEKQQLDFILKYIRKHRIGGRNAKELAILYRNNLSSILIADMLDRQGIGFFTREGKPGFFSHWFVLDMQALLRLALSPDDEEAFKRIYYKLNRYISRAMLEAAMKTEKKGSMVDRLLISDSLKPFQRQNLIKLKDELKRLARLTPAAALRYIDNTFGYMDGVKDYCSRQGYSYSYVQNLNTIIGILASDCGTLSQFLIRFEELEEIFRESGRQRAGITLSTVHSSKGLEYDCVMMVDLYDGEFPDRQSVDEAQKGQNDLALQEERRLFYVGMTRAREEVYLLCPKMKNGISTERSLFVCEVEKCLENKALGDIGEGCIVKHKVYGEGAVVEIIGGTTGSRTTVRVDFKGTQRLLDLGTCLSKGIISI